MKLRFAAIDQQGRVIRGVLRADTLEEAREALMGEGIFPKTLDAVDESEKVTWAPRSRIRERLASAQGGGFSAGDKPPLRDTLFPTTRHAASASAPGRLGLAEDGTTIFQPTDGPEERLTAADLELATAAGFPARRLRLVTLDGRTIEFTAGFLLLNPRARKVLAALKGKKAAPRP